MLLASSMKHLYLLLAFFISLNVSAVSFDTNIPYSEAFLGWSTPKGYQDDSIHFDRLSPKDLNCQSQLLYPTHPQQNLKIYHIYRHGKYNHFKLKGDDEACAISAKQNNGRGFKNCFRPDLLVDVVLSDTYMDSCGNYYRAFNHVQFFSRLENMGHLFTPGRTLYQDPQSNFENDFIVGQTYFVNLSDFLLVTELFPGDFELIKQYSAEALKTHVFDKNTYLYTLAP